ncbi:kinesin-like protein KIN-6 isoform X6 [Ricinus communis]|uniref:kinesin-like protein KIN-6 isoform X6 n=1 Tax=Ricinus communis TaxID=3988 RepID=UPI00201B327A|nr:kinesin-like protein KIN-6 isoform X6 [Ricinus communis]
MAEMEIKTLPPCPSTVTVRRNPHRRARPTPPVNFTPSSISKSNKQDIPSFPIEDILSIEVPQPEPTLAPPVSENLKVFLRIKPLRPLKSPPRDQSLKLRHKSAWPQAKKNSIRENNNNTTKKKKNNEVCISVNGFQSVTLSPPLALQESKRIKSVVYEGFSHVFASDSSQNAVYDKMVKPLVDDFLKGKSGMLAALGPSGSGKTHTVFGTVKQPGMVPLALQHIFKQNQASGSALSRSFYISIFEIYSEGGKVERMFDLSPDGVDLSMQQSTIKGLQEIPITDAAQAESLIASAMLKRATAMTNTNSQSSRSQCIINIHGLVDKCNREVDVQPNNAVLTIVDLAGAERERRTGNQGSRLLESNFINNTSMVFGLCLRSLLEHQKNPKKPLQKHFQNSLLTRYLRDYLEGKKRMALILTVKPGEEDYLDTVYLLRQASPYMKIRFNNVEEQPNSVHQKRQIQLLSIIEEPRKKKCCGIDGHVIEEGQSTANQHLHLEEDAPRITKLDSVEIAPVKSDCNDLAMRERNHKIMQSFAKALWNVLKEYKGKLMVAEKTIENLRSEKSKYLELEQKLEDFKSCCTCSQKNSAKTTFHKVENGNDVPVYLEGNECSNVDEIKMLDEFKCYNSPTMCNLDQDLLSQMNAGVCVVNPEASECNSTCSKRDSSPEWDKDLFSQVEVSSNSPDLKPSEFTINPRGDQDVTSQTDGNVPSSDLEESKCYSTPRYDQEILTLTNVNVSSPNLKEFECSSTPRCNQDISYLTDVNVHPSELKASQCSSMPRQDQDLSTMKPLDLPQSHKNDVECNLDVPDTEVLSNTSSKSLNLKKPKRRLLPASSVLLRDITALGIENEPEKSKGNRGGNKLAAVERTQGSSSLLRLLQSNLRL